MTFSNLKEPGQKTRRYFEEKRDFIRMNVEIPMKFRHPAAEKLGSGQTQNLSATGLAFETQDPVALGDHLEIWISSFGTHIPPLKGKMIVTRVSFSREQIFSVQGKLHVIE